MSLGFISDRYESGNRGAGTISSGTNDPGGKSYGIYQLSKIMLWEYLKQAAFEFRASAFTLEFDAEWGETAARYPTEFALDQHLFIAKRLYIPNIIFAKSLGYHTKDRRIQEAIFSIAVQHGGATHIIKKAFDGEANTVEQLQDLYKERWEYVKSLGLAEDLKQTLQKRYVNELKDVLAIQESAFD